jgi:hypothetical protein
MKKFAIRHRSVPIATELDDPGARRPRHVTKPTFHLRRMDHAC